MDVLRPGTDRNMRWRLFGYAVYGLFTIGFLVAGVGAAAQAHWRDAALWLGVAAVLAIPRLLAFFSLRRIRNRDT